MTDDIITVWWEATYLSAMTTLCFFSSFLTFRMKGGAGLPFHIVVLSVPKTKRCLMAIENNVLPIKNRTSDLTINFLRKKERKDAPHPRMATGTMIVFPNVFTSSSNAFIPSFLLQKPTSPSTSNASQWSLYSSATLQALLLSVSHKLPSQASSFYSPVSKHSRLDLWPKGAFLANHDTSCLYRVASFTLSSNGYSTKCVRTTDASIASPLQIPVDLTFSVMWRLSLWG